MWPLAFVAGIVALYAWSKTRPANVQNPTFRAGLPVALNFTDTSGADALALTQAFLGVGWALAPGLTNVGTGLGASPGGMVWYAPIAIPTNDLPVVIESFPPSVIQVIASGVHLPSSDPYIALTR